MIGLDKTKANQKGVKLTLETCLYVRKIFTSKCILSFTLFHLIRGVANNKEGLKNFIFLVNLWRGGTNKLNWMDKN